MIELQKWHVVSASVTGAAHSKQGKGNEDASLCASLLDGTLVLIAADGAGSAACAAEGSSLAVQGSLEVLQSRPLPSTAAGWTTFLPELSCQVRTMLQEIALETNQSLKDFASTLLLVVITDAHVAALQIGDGAIVVKTKNSLMHLTNPFRGTYASETVFLTSETFLGHASCNVIPKEHILGLALLTDGLEPVAFDLRTDEPFKPFFEPLFSFAKNSANPYERGLELAKFLNSDRMRQRTDDDKTLILAVK